jgi:hypothetical protein
MTRLGLCFVVDDKFLHGKNVGICYRELVKIISCHECTYRLKCVENYIVVFVIFVQYSGRFWGTHKTSYAD